jgi:predicted AlkP superfamily pyrophosphatase or phosphodiesterase
MEVQPIVLINAVGLTARWLAFAPRLQQLACSGWALSLDEIVPAVTCSAQASLLTGKTPENHGIVGNGWFFRETGEIRFWLQSSALLQAEPIYATARRLARDRGRTFRAAKLFWWFNQGAPVDISVTPKPYYGADGNKVFGITGTPEGLTDRLERDLGRFPFHTFWGPSAGLPCTRWIAQAAAEILDRERPDLTLVYLPILITTPSALDQAGATCPGLPASSTPRARPCSIGPGQPVRECGW